MGRKRVVSPCGVVGGWREGGREVFLTAGADTLVWLSVFAETVMLCDGDWLTCKRGSGWRMGRVTGGLVVRHVLIEVVECVGVFGG